jgi:hypothetical protein
MLDIGNDESLTTMPWDRVELKTNLPKGMQDFFEYRGTMPVHPQSRRAYSRFYLRSRAILRRQDVFLGVYTADASRQGIKFLSPVQLLPKERCRIRLPNTKEFQIEIVRCRRVDEGCYECGAMFVLGIPTKPDN